MNIFRNFAVFLLLAISSSSVLAEACTYREAIMAMEQGNTKRGIALMRMARNDGDRRASEYLAMKGYPLEAGTSTNHPPLKSMISLNRIDP